MTFDHDIMFGKDRYHLIEDMSAWCRKNIGPGGFLINDHCVWKIVVVFGNSTFSFKREADATMFMLRWR